MPIHDLFDPRKHLTPDRQAKRLAICRGCPYIRKRVGVERCSLCGCFLNLKTRLKTEHCPIYKWKEE